MTQMLADPGATAHALARRFGDALRTGHGVDAEKVIDDALAGGMDAPEIHVSVIAPALVRIGELWEAQLVGVAEEHLATAICERALMRLFEKLMAHQTAAPSRREKVLLAASAGQHHVLGLRMVADVLEGAGFDVVHLGADMPAGSLTTYVEEHQPAVVGISFGMAVDISGLADTLGAIHDCAPATRIMLGGRAVPPGFRVGGYPYVSSPREVVGAVEGLLEGPAQPLPSIVELLRTGERMRSWAMPHAADGVADRLAQASEHAFSVARSHARRAEAFRDLALKDPLTGMANRRAFDDELTARTGGDGPPGALLMLDIDFFKNVNDTFGHDSGDEVLRTVGRAITAALGPGDLAARFGGDEFAVLLAACTPELAAAVAERIRHAVAASPGRPTTVSVGIAPVTSDPRADVLAADTALYEAKKLGRDCVALASGSVQPVQTAEPYVAMSRLAVPGPRAPELVAALRSRLRSAAPAGAFVDLQAWQSERDAGEIITVSRWRDREAFTTHMCGPEHGTTRDRVDPELTQDIRLAGVDHLHSYRVVAQ